jgi:hypothetical protein
VGACAFRPDGRLDLSASHATDDRALRLWEVATGVESTHWLTDAALYCCTYRPDARQASAGDASGGVHFLEVVGT